MSNLILGVTPTKKLTHRLYIGVETDWTLKENNQIAPAGLGESKASTYGVRTRITRSSRDGGPREGGDDGSGP